MDGKKKFLYHKLVFISQIFFNIRITNLCTYTIPSRHNFFCSLVESVTLITPKNHGDRTETRPTHRRLPKGKGSSPGYGSDLSTSDWRDFAKRVLRLRFTDVKGRWRSASRKQNKKLDEER